MKKFFGFLLGAALGLVTVTYAQIVPGGGTVSLYVAQTWTATQTFTNITVNGTCTGCSAAGAITGSLTSGQIPYATAATVLASNAAFTYDVTNHAVKVNNDFYAAVTAGSANKYALRVGANDSDGYGGQLILEGDSNDANNPRITTYSSVGNMGTPGANSSGDNLFQRIHYGFDGTGFFSAADELVTVSGAVSAGVVPGKLTYSVTKPVSGTATFTLDGNIPSAAFNVPVKATGYLSSDGSAGVTVTACTLFKNGLCVAGT